MITEKTEDLIWQKIEGTIGPEDETRLEEILGSNTDVREHYEELVKFSSVLGGVEELELPTTLRQRIEGAIDFGRYAARDESTTPAFWRRWLPLRPSTRFAMAVVTGVVIGVAGYHLVGVGPPSNGSLDHSVVTGTIGAARDGIAIDLDGVDGSVSFRQQGTRAICEITIASKREITLYIEYEGHPVHFSANGDVNSPLHDISVAGNGIVVNNLGSADYIAAFSSKDGAGVPLRMRIVEGGELLLDEEIQLRR